MRDKQGTKKYFVDAHTELNPNCFVYCRFWLLLFLRSEGQNINTSRETTNGF